MSASVQAAAAHATEAVACPLYHASVFRKTPDSHAGSETAPMAVHSERIRPALYMSLHASALLPAGFSHGAHLKKLPVRGIAAPAATLAHRKAWMQAFLVRLP